MPALALAPAPACRLGADPTPLADYADWARVLVDTDLRLPPGYVPQDLVPASRAGFRAPAWTLVRAFVVPDLEGLREAAAAAGSSVGVVSTYRSFRDQQLLYAGRPVRDEDVGVQKTARPGHSEHQLGTTVDFKTAGDKDVDPGWASTPTGRWMQENAWRFGFVPSYPEGRTAQTCYPYEPWHYRYFGRDLARLIHESGLTTREYLWAWSHLPPSA